jgi:PAS domain S-box-containing protein
MLVIIGVVEMLPIDRAPALSLVLALCIGYSVLIGGLVSGLVTGAIAVAYVAYYYADQSLPLHYSSLNLGRLIIFVSMSALVIATTANIRQRLDTILVRERSLRIAAEAERKRTVDVMESITDGLFALDRQWRFTYVNRQAEQLVGRRREDLLGKVVWDVFPPLIGSTWDREYHRAVENRIPVHFEEFYPPLETWFETHAYPSEDGIAIYIRSINERKQAEQTLRARARQQAAAAQLGQEALLGGDLSSLLNSAALAVSTTLDIELVKILELLPEQAELVMRAGVGWKEGVEHRVPAGLLSQAGYTLASHEPVIVEDLSTEKRFIGPPLLVDHGVESGMSVIISGPDHPFGILGAHARTRRTFTESDINFLQAVANVLAEAIERKRGEEALAESEQRFRQIAENVREVFYLTNISPLQLLYVSPSYQAVWGRSCQSLHDQPLSWIEAIHPDDRPQMEACLHTRNTGGLFDGEYRIMRPDGSVRWIRDRSSPVLDHHGRAYRVVGVAEDITQLREAEEVAKRLVASEAAVRARDEVLAVVAHDLRNPLSTIAIAARLLGSRGMAADTSIRQAATISRAVESANQLIRNLLDVGRIEAGQLIVEAEPLDVSSVTAEATDRFSLLASEKDITLNFEVPPNMPSMFGDRERILQVLDNLLGNALKFTPRGGRVTVRAQTSDEGVEFSVQDTGVGMAPEMVPHVFDRFWRARPADRKGLGLGLAIVKGIVDAHHGKVWAESEPGQGSIFYFTIPGVVPYWTTTGDPNSERGLRLQE